MNLGNPASGDNLDKRTVEGFGAEWSRFDQQPVSADEQVSTFDEYFSIFPWAALPDKAKGFDAGSGSGRWAQLVAPRVGELHCVDASTQAVEVTLKAVGSLPNVRVHRASIMDMPFADESMDFGYSIGVLHHLPDPQGGLDACARKLRSGAPFLTYLYYALDGRPAWFRAAWKATDWARRVICRLPRRLRVWMTGLIAAIVYFPLARAARLGAALNRDVEGWPLSHYRHRSFYTMRTDSLDRFGTPLERRFTRKQVESMMVAAGLADIAFSNSPPYWCAVGFKRGSSST